MKENGCSERADNNLSAVNIAVAKKIAFQFEQADCLAKRFSTQNVQKCRFFARILQRFLFRKVF